MNFQIEKLVWYAEQIYDMQIKISYSKDNTIMFIHTPFDDFKIHLNDKERFGEYTLFHQNKHKNKNYWHTQGKFKKLEFLIYMCVVHGFNKCHNIETHTDDYVRFKADVRKAWKWEYGN